MNDTDEEYMDHPVFNYGVNYDTLARMNRTKAATQWPGTDRYQVGLEAFHQLHCLVW
jgi:hypothetical protein